MEIIKLVRDNCKDCVRNCEFAGTDREFIIRGDTCKITRSEVIDEKSAKKLIMAIKALVKKHENLENFERYLMKNFSKWLKEDANTPEKIAEELFTFSEVSFYRDKQY